MTIIEEAKGGAFLAAMIDRIMFSAPEISEFDPLRFMNLLSHMTMGN